MLSPSTLNTLVKFKISLFHLNLNFIIIYTSLHLIFTGTNQNDRGPGNQSESRKMNLAGRGGFIGSADLPRSEREPACLLAREKASARIGLLQDHVIISKSKNE